MDAIQRNRDSRQSEERLLRKTWGENSQNFASNHELEPCRIDPDSDLAARTKKGDELFERSSRVRGVMEHTDAVNEVEGLLPERQGHDVGSVDVNVGSKAKVFSSGENGLAEVHGVDLSPGVGGDLREAAHATARVKNAFCAKVLETPAGLLDKCISASTCSVGGVELSLRKTIPLEPKRVRVAHFRRSYRGRTQVTSATK